MCGVANTIAPRRVIAFRSHGMARSGAPGGNVMDLITRLRMFAHDEEGQDLLEYALLVALIALVCVTAIGLAGTKVQGVFTQIAAAI
jgi:Flp pilus assembly pilin Flp